MDWRFSRVTFFFRREEKRAVKSQRRPAIQQRERGALCAGRGVCFQLDMKQAFVSIVSSYVGYGLASILRHNGYSVVGSIRSEGEENFCACAHGTMTQSQW